MHGTVVHPYLQLSVNGKKLKEQDTLEIKQW